VAVSCPADTPNDLHEQLTSCNGRLKIKLRVGVAGVDLPEQLLTALNCSQNNRCVGAGSAAECGRLAAWDGEPRVGCT
jgi:hypothetical protein